MGENSKAVFFILWRSQHLCPKLFCLLFLGLSLVTTSICCRRNARGQTALHCVCQISHQKSPSALERRSYSVILLLSWRGPLLPNGERERVEVAAKDVRGNTALHYASANGLKRCVEYLVAHGADVLTENFDGLTAYDLANRENHGDIVVFLESKMTVFNQTPEDIHSEATLSASGSLGRSSFEVTEADEISNGPLLRSQDLQEAKDQLIIDMSLTLSLPKVNAEAILRQNEWSKEVVLENWRRDPIETCSMAGIQPPAQPPGRLSHFISLLHTVGCFPPKMLHYQKKN